MTTEKLTMKTTNMADENFRKLQELFPEAVTEIEENGKIVRAIDKDKLQQLISTSVVDGSKERYQFTWPGKREAVLLANTPTNKTLRPVKGENKTDDACFNSTENLYIEGDNLEVLKLLQEKYLGKIKMIYIDPPYNTGNDFIYKDNFAKDTKFYKNNSGQTDEEGNRLVKNLESNGRFHSDWLNMLYSRLKIARNLLSDDGVIFVSIDDKEQENLKKLCDEIFGESNFVTNLVWQSTGGSNTGNNIVTITEYIFVFCKSRNSLKIKLLEKNNEKYLLEDKHLAERGRFYLQKLDGKFTKDHYTESLNYPILYNGKNIWPGGEEKPSNELWNWRWSKKKVEWGIENEFIDFINDNGKVTVKFKNYEKVDNSNNPRLPSVTPKNLILSSVCTTSTGTIELTNILGSSNIFDFPKCSILVKYLLNLINIYDGYILDFFSGSATTAHAVMQLNAEDGGNRKFIMVQLPEVCDEKSEAYKAGYNTICDIGKERIRRAGAKIKEELEKTNPERAKTLDTGFRVLRLDSSNMKDVFYRPVDLKRDELMDFTENVKEDRNEMDLLFQIMPELNADYTSKIEETYEDGKKIFNVESNYIVACFAEDISEKVIRKVASYKPDYAVFRDSCFPKDSDLANVEQIFRAESPETRLRIL